MIAILLFLLLNFARTLPMDVETHISGRDVFERRNLPSTLFIGVVATQKSAQLHLSGDRHCYILKAEGRTFLVSKDFLSVLCHLSGNWHYCMSKAEGRT